MNIAKPARIIARLIPYVAGLGLFATSDAYAACNCGSTNALEPCTGRTISVSVGDQRQVSFFWTFHSEQSAARCGQFANGDYWIAPAQGKSSVTISTLETSGSGPITLDENPTLESMGLLSATEAYRNYNAEESLLDDLPMAFNQPTSLVAAIQRDETRHGRCGTRAIEGNCAEAYNIVTVLDSVPPFNGAKSIRPSIDEQEKIVMTLDDFQWSRLSTRSFFTGTDSAGIERIRERWSHSTEIFGVKSITGETFSEGGRAFRADLLIDDYAAGTARIWHDNLFTIMSDNNTLAQKMPALAAMVTYGKDIYHAIFDGDERKRNWGVGAGQSLGRFPAALLFASLAKDPSFANNMTNTSTTLLGFEDIRGPHELDQINSGVNTPVWGDFPDTMTQLDVGAYWGSVLRSQCFDGATGQCNPNIGKKTSRDPYGYIDGPPNLPGSSYMSVSIGPMRSFMASMFLIPEMCKIVNYDELLTYIDRVEKVGIHTENDRCAPPDPRENPDTCDAFRARNCEYYGLSNTGVATWGPNPNNPSQCIENAPGQNGRFPDRHGTPLGKGGYTSRQVEQNWERIRGDADSCIFFRSEPPKSVDLSVRTSGS